MKRTPFLAFAFVAALFFTPAGRAAEAVRHDPVTPGSSKEARALLEVLYGLSGKYTLTGQHNFPNTKDLSSQYYARYTGKAPAVWSTDFGHAKAGDSDSYLARPDIVKEAIRQHQLGALVTICWHAIPPTADEPGTFRPLPGADPKKLASVQGQLLDEQFKDLLTPGTAIYNHWCEQVDAVAVFLKQLDEARVPVLWRPYHEMNGDWFWWGHRPGANGTAALYRQLFDRLVNHHQLKNLIWVWSVDRVSAPNMEHEKYFPGIQYVDILGLDVYKNDFKQSYYESLLALSQGKPLTLAEVGNPPSSAILDQQPNWLYYVTWSGMIRNTPRRHYQEFARDTRRLGLRDAKYAELFQPLRDASGLPPIAAGKAPVDLTGFWVLNEEKCEIDPMNGGGLPQRVEVTQTESAIKTRTSYPSEFSADRVVDETYALDGSETTTEIMHAPRVVSAKFSGDGKALVVNATFSNPWSGPGVKLHSEETWTLEDYGQSLVIHRVTTTPQGTQKVKLVLERR